MTKQSDNEKSYINPNFYNSSSYKKGLLAECWFELYANKNGWEVEPSSVEDNIKKHIDYTIKRGLTRFTVDIKSMTKISRHDKCHNTEWVWIEIRNVRGNKGWLFGKQDLMCFEREDRYFFIKLTDLHLALDKHLCPISEIYKMACGKHKITPFEYRTKWVKTAKEAKYKFYSRKDRDDINTLIEFKLLEPYKFFEWKKC